MIRWCLFIDSATTWSQIAASLERHGSDVAIVAVEEPRTAVQALAQAGLPWRLFATYGPKEAAVNIEVIRWLRRLSCTPNFHGFSLQELLIDEDRSLWWLIDIWLLRTIYLPPLHRVARRYYQILAAARDEKPVMFISTVRDFDFNRCLDLVGRDLGIPAVKPNWHWPSRLRMLRAKLLAFLAFCRPLLRKPAYRLQLLRYHRQSIRSSVSRAGRILIFTGDNWQEVFEKDSGCFVRGDGYAHNILRELGEFNVTFVVSLHPTRAKLTHFGERIRAYPHAAYKPLDGYLRLHHLLESLRAGRRMASRLIAICKSRGESFGSDDQFLWDLLSERLRLLASFPIREAILNLKLAHQAIQDEAPAVVLSFADQERSGKAIALATLAHGIPYLVALHGLLASDNPYFHLTDDDISQGRQDVRCAFPFPDRVFVYARRDKDLLVSRGRFPPDSVVVTGDPRWEFAAHVRDSLSEGDVSRREGLDPRKPIVVFTSQTLYSEEEERRIVELLCTACGNINRCQLVIKLHPNQTDLDEVRYKKVVYSSARDLDVFFRRGRDLYPLLRLCDVLVTVASTTALEAVIMGKPVVIVDPYDRGYRNSLGEHTVFKVARDTDELRAILRSILFDDDFAARFEHARRDFEQEWGVPTEGFVSHKISQTVRQLANSGRAARMRAR